MVVAVVSCESEEEGHGSVVSRESEVRGGTWGTSSGGGEEGEEEVEEREGEGEGEGGDGCG